MNNELLVLVGILVLLMSTALGSLIDNAIQCRKLINFLKEEFYYDKKRIRK